MKTLKRHPHLTRFTLFAILLSGCLWISPSGCTNAGTNAKWLEQAFGDALRSAEGQYAADQIPGVVMALRNKWLPPGKQWDNFAGKLIHEFVVANPKNNAEVNKVLEELAMRLQTNGPTPTP